MRWISITAIGSTPAKGSSSRIKRGLVASARAISTRRRSPPDKAGAGAVAHVADLQLVEQASSSRSISALAASSVGAARARRGCCPDAELAEDRRLLRQVAQAEAGALVHRQAVMSAVEQDLAGVARTRPTIM
jgi:hypothetical protein